MFRPFARSRARRPASPPSRRSTYLQLESLESRLTPSTTAKLTSGVLQVTADANVEIFEQSTPMTYTVAAADTLIGGPTFTGVKSIQVTESADAGVEFVGDPTQGTALQQKLTVTGSADMQVLFASNFNVNGAVVIGLTNADTIGYLGVEAYGPNTTFGSLQVLGRNGGTHVDLYGGVTVNGSATLNLGNGFNEVTMSLPFYADLPTGTTINGNLTINGGSQIDNVTLWDDLYVRGNLSANLGGGTNTFESWGTAILSTDLSTVVGNLSVTSGSVAGGGTLFAEIDGTTVDGNVTVNAAQDTDGDVVDLGGVYGLDSIKGFLSVTTGSGAGNAVVVVGAHVSGKGGLKGNSITTTGLGDNFIFMADSTFQGAFNFNLGGGDNILDIEVPGEASYLSSILDYNYTYDYGADGTPTVFLGPVTVTTSGTGSNTVDLGNYGDTFDQVQFASSANFVGGTENSNTLYEDNVAFSVTPKIIRFTVLP